MFNFNTSVKIGDAGESLFLHNYPEWKKVGAGIYFPYDFINDKMETLELKTDTYGMSATPNYFMEYQSNMERETPGGIFRFPDLTYLAYLFINDRVIFHFKRCDIINVLIERGYIDETLKAIRIPRQIKNTTHITTGWAIPRAYFDSHVLMAHELDED